MDCGRAGAGIRCGLRYHFVLDTEKETLRRSDRCDRLIILLILV